MNDNTFKVLAEAARYASGTHFLDSGGAYGRHWQKPPIEKKDESVSIEVWGENEILATMETCHFLANTSSHLKHLQERFDEWEGDQEGSWFECGEDFCTKELGLVKLHSDNTYNSENDLSQDFVYAVYDIPESETDDWIYSESAIFVVWIHTGCDIRGGYSPPIFLQSEGDYAVPVDFCVGWNFDEVSIDGEEIEETWEFDDRFQTGYSSNPTYQLNQHIDFVFAPWSAKHGYVLLKMDNGAVVKAVPTVPICQ